MTELYEFYQGNREEALEKIKAMDTSSLFAKLDNTLQCDMLDRSNAKLGGMPNMWLYSALLSEIRERCQWNEPITPPGDPQLTPSLHGEDCLGNGEHEGFECCCDECDYYLICWPDWRELGN